MYSYGLISSENLASAHPLLQAVFNEIIKHRDCSITDGHRGKLIQNQLFYSGKSKTPWPESKHNHRPSYAVDAVPYPFKPQWWDRKKYFHIWAEWGGWVVGFAEGMGVGLRWGGDWNRNHDADDERFFDGPHFELAMEVIENEENRIANPNYFGAAGANDTVGGYDVSDAVLPVH
jgi:peptidoglycan L-alanyl-D-glutamate endopeptidase CwlK